MDSLFDSGNCDSGTQFKQKVIMSPSSLPQESTGTKKDLARREFNLLENALLFHLL